MNAGRGTGVTAGGAGVRVGAVARVGEEKMRKGKEKGPAMKRERKKNLNGKLPLVHHILFIDLTV